MSLKQLFVRYEMKCEMAIKNGQVCSYLKSLQAEIVAGLESLTGDIFQKDPWQYAQGAGGGLTCIVMRGGVLEKGGVNFSHVKAEALPDTILRSKPDLLGYQFEAMGVSLVIHPVNPFVPTTHMNVRYFHASHVDSEKPDRYWFGGGFDLTPYYPFMEDCVYWHQMAKNAVSPFDEVFGEDLYARYKAECDAYFYLPHRKEMRGVGGLFFDHLNIPSFEDCFALQRSVGDHFLKAYLPILEKHMGKNYTPEQKHWQRCRRGRYVEFNLLYDKGTKFGLESSGRTESILMSLPLEVIWEYDPQVEEGTLEAELFNYLKPQDWLGR